MCIVDFWSSEPKLVGRALAERGGGGGGGGGVSRHKMSYLKISGGPIMAAKFGKKVAAIFGPTMPYYVRPRTKYRIHILSGRTSIIVPGENCTGRYIFSRNNCTTRYSFGCENCTALAKSVPGFETLLFFYFGGFLCPHHRFKW